MHAIMEWVTHGGLICSHADTHSGPPSLMHACASMAHPCSLQSWVVTLSMIAAMSATRGTMYTSTVTKVSSLVSR